MQIAPSTYHARKACPVTAAEWDDAHTANRLLDLWRANRSLYGATKLHAAALDDGMQLGRDHVARLMHLLDIQGVRRGWPTTTTTTRDASAPRHPDLVKRAWNTPTAPDQWWVADFTYVWTIAGFVYVSFITDVYSRRILGWRASMTKTTDLVLSALHQALCARRRTNPTFHTAGLVHHSDAGSQYTAFTFTQALADAGISPSIGTVGDALDNALMESTIGLYKTELIHHLRTAPWSGLNEVEAETAGYVHWFNQTRIHLSIGKMAPARYEQQWTDTRAA